LDVVLLLLLSLLILNDVFEIEYFEYLYVSATLMALIFAEFIIARPLFEGLLFFPLRHTAKQRDSTMVDKWVDLKLMVDSRQADKLEIFIAKMRRELTDPRWLQRLADLDDEKDYGFKRKTLHDFIVQSLTTCAQHSSLMRHLLMGLYSPDPRVFPELDLSRWDYRREYYRILADNDGGKVLEEFEFAKQQRQMQSVLAQCSEARELFTRELRRESVDQDKVLRLGDRVVRGMEGFLREKVENKHICPKTLLCFFKFSEACLGTYFSHQVSEEGAEGLYQKETEACVVVGVREGQLGRLLKVNTEFQKLGCFSNAHIKALTLRKAVGARLEAHVLELIAREGRRLEERSLSVKEERELGWLCGSMGFVTVCEWDIQSSHYHFEECLNLVARPLFCEKPVILVDEKGKILGVTELSRYFGYSAAHAGCDVDHVIMHELLHEGAYEVREGESLLNGQDLRAKCSFHMAVLRRSGELRSGSTLVVGLAFQQAQTHDKSVRVEHVQPPRFEFHFNWQGIISSQKTEQNLPVFEESVERRVDVDYGEDIVEMRFFDEKIDYKANFEEEQDCPALPRQLEEDFEEVTEEQFLEKVRRKKALTPSGLKGTVCLLGALMVASCAAFIFMLVSFNSYAASNIRNLSLICKII
jgi:hypothetical protein